MTFPIRFMQQPCVITHVSWDGTPDEYGDATETTTTTTLDGNPGCFLTGWGSGAQSRAEDTDRTNQQTDKWTGYFPPTIELGGSDRVQVDGRTFEVVGPPSRPYNPIARGAQYVEATLVEVI